MGIKALCAAAAVLVASVEAADAATVIKDYDLQLRYEGASYSELVFWALNNSGETVDEGWIDHLPHKDVPAWLKNPSFPDLSIGSVISFVARVVFTDEVRYDGWGYSYSGSAPACQISNISCTMVNNTLLLPDGSVSLVIGRDADVWLDFKPVVGGAFEYALWNPDRSFAPIYDDGEVAYYIDAMFEYSDFTVVSANIAPIPLPASAALLPFGLGALAFLRKRRRQVS